MNGAFLDALAILLGSLAGLVRTTPLPVRAQVFFRTVVGAGTIFTGVRLIGENLGYGFLPGLKRVLIAFLAVVLGFWLGRLLRLQMLSNTAGRWAGQVIRQAATRPATAGGAGWLACVALFGAAPLGWLGAVEEGLTGGCYLLAVKALMDALAMLGWVRLLGWPAALSAFPVLALFGGLTWLVQQHAAPVCVGHHLSAPLNVTTGLLACAVSLVIFEVRKVELANFLPALAMAPLLAWWWG